MSGMVREAEQSVGHALLVNIVDMDGVRNETERAERIVTKFCENKAAEDSFTDRDQLLGELWAFARTHFLRADGLALAESARHFPKLYAYVRTQQHRSCEDAARAWFLAELETSPMAQASLALLLA